MRGLISVKAIVVGGLLLAGVSGLGAASGCKKEEAKKPAEDKAGTEAAGSAGAGGDTEADREKKKAINRSKGQALGARLGLQPITIEEVKPLLPGLKGGTSLGEPVSTARGLRVTAMECVTGEMAEIKSNLEARLKELGFTTVRASERKTMNIVTVSAEKSPYRMSASLRSGPYPDCPADQKKSKLLMSYFKRPPRPPGATGAGTPPPGHPATGAAGAAGSTGAKTVVPPPEGGSKPAPAEEKK